MERCREGPTSREKRATCVEKKKKLMENEYWLDEKADD